MAKYSNVSLIYSTIVLILSHLSYGTEATTRSKNGTIFKFIKPMIEVPAVDNHSVTIIFLHAVNQTANDVKPVLETLRRHYMKLVLPTMNSMPLVNQLGLLTSAWNRSYISKDINLAEIERAVIEVHELIEREIDNGIRANRILIGGYAQGGLLSFHCGQMYPEQLGGFIGFGVWPHIEILQKPNPGLPEGFLANTNIPVCQVNDDHSLNPKNVSIDRKFVYHTGRGHPVTDEQFGHIDLFFEQYLPQI